MKTWEDLTKKEQEIAVEHEIDGCLRVLVQGGIRFVDPELQARLEAAYDEAEAMHTPWFTHECIWEDPALREIVRGIAQVVAEDALYPELGDYVSEAKVGGIQ